MLIDLKCRACRSIFEVYTTIYEKDSNTNCKHCDSPDTFRYYGNQRLRFNGFGRCVDISGVFDSREPTVSEIDRYCKKTNSHFMSQEDQARTAKQYKKQNDIDSKRDTEKKVEKEMKRMQKDGLFA